MNAAATTTVRNQQQQRQRQYTTTTADDDCSSCSSNDSSTNNTSTASNCRERYRSVLLEYMEHHEQCEKTVWHSSVSMFVLFTAMGITFTFMSMKVSSGVVTAILGLYFLYWDLLRKSILRNGTLLIAATHTNEPDPESSNRATPHNNNNINSTFRNSSFNSTTTVTTAEAFPKAIVTNVRDLKRKSSSKNDTKEIQFTFTDENGNTYVNNNAVWFEIDGVFVTSNSYRGPIDVFYYQTRCKNTNKKETSSSSTINNSSPPCLTVLPRSTVYLRTAILYSKSVGMIITYCIPFVLYLFFSFLFMLVVSLTVPAGVLSVDIDRILTAVVACILSIVFGTLCHAMSHIKREQFVLTTASLSDTTTDIATDTSADRDEVFTLDILNSRSSCSCSCADIDIEYYEI